MIIVTRKAAKAAGLNKYHTGIPCKNGHIDYRYTASGACKSCIAKYNGQFIPDAEPEVVAAKANLDAAMSAYKEAIRLVSERSVQRRSAKSDARSTLVQVRVRLYEDDRENVAAAAWAMAAMRHPTLTMGDIDPQSAPKDKVAGTALFAFNCHADDIDLVKQLAAESIDARRVDIAAIRDRSFK